MHILEHLFLIGEFAERAHLLSGLTLEQVTLRPEGASTPSTRSCGTLWDTSRASLPRGGAPPGDLFPTTYGTRGPIYQLVQLFLTGARAAADLGLTPERCCSSRTRRHPGRRVELRGRA